MRLKLLYWWRRLVRSTSTYGWCFRCGLGWNEVTPHETWYGKKMPGTKGTWGCFPLCEGCWTALGHPRARMPYYWKLWKDWMKDAATRASIETRNVAGGDQWSAIEDAVWEGR